MAAFLIIGAVGIVLLVISLALDDLVDGLFDQVGGDYLSGAALAAFLGALGFVGALTLNLTSSIPIAILIGVLSGVGLGALAGWFTMRLRKGGDAANVRTADLVGQEGNVTTPIPSDGYGVVSIVVAGHITRLNAQADHPISSGTPIVITEVLSATAVRVAHRSGTEWPVNELR